MGLLAFERPGDSMTRETFVINVGKVTGGEGQTTGPLKLWKRDYYPLIADITFAGIAMMPVGTGLYNCR